MSSVFIPTKNVIDFTMGADPEFVCLDGDDKVVKASSSCEWERGSDRDKLGADGNGIVFEVRPKPTTDPLKIVHDIHSTFMKHIGKFPKFANYKWLAGSCQKNMIIGGHVHFGFKPTTATHQDYTYMLSQYVGSISILLEDKTQGKRRRNDYGFYGDHREQTYGLEYRSMGSWLTSPYIASAFLCLSKIVMFEALNNPNFNISPNFFSASDFDLMNTDRIRSKFPEIWAAITKTVLYQVYKPHVDILYYLVEKKLSWFPKEYNMNNSWGLVSKESVDMITMKMLWARWKQRERRVRVPAAQPRPSVPSSPLPIQGSIVEAVEAASSDDCPF
jgi:hypothetical protein